MKTMIAMITLSTGLLLGCQDKPAEKSLEKAKVTHEMNHKDGEEMDHKQTKMNMDSSGTMDQDMAKDHDPINQDMNIAYYTCPMESHKHVHSDVPGDCPECGMEMVAVSEVSPADADFYGCPMPEHSHVRADEAGACPECGMQLKPMKLDS